MSSASTKGKPATLRVETLEERRMLSVSAAALNTQFARNLFNDAVGRDPAPAEVAAVQAEIAANGYASVAAKVLAAPEAREHQANQLYVELLGRQTGPVERANAGAALSILGDKAFTRAILTSDEYFAIRGVTTDGMVRGWYEDMLDRPADPAGLTYWKNVVAVRGRDEAAHIFLDQPEVLRNLVDDWYRLYLERPAEEAALDYWATNMLAGGRQLQIRASIVADAEYRDLATDVVVDWNEHLLNSLKDTNIEPTDASRIIAMTQIAVYDAVNAILQTHDPFHATTVTTGDESIVAAAAAAAHRVLVNAFPVRQTLLDAELEKSLRRVTDSAARDAGVAVGVDIADQILAWRATDGFDAPVIYSPSGAPGDWAPTPPAFAPAIDPQWPGVTPFAMTSGDQFRFPGPPDITSVQYAADYQEVAAYGRVDSTVRTADQTQAAQFWTDGPGTYTPAGRWNEILQEVAVLRGHSIAENARYFAALGVGLADAAIVAWDAKYEYDFWRPVTAIIQGDSDANPLTTGDTDWLPLVTTPPSPEYISAHSAFSGVADAILTTLIGPGVSFTSSTTAATRTFASFNQAANEAGQSRVYAGVNFQTSNQHGLSAGRALGNYVVSNFFGPAS